MDISNLIDNSYLADIRCTAYSYCGCSIKKGHNYICIAKLNKKINIFDCDDSAMCGKYSVKNGIIMYKNNLSGLEAKFYK